MSYKPFGFIILILYRAQHGRLFTSCRAGKIKMVDSFLIQLLNRQSLRCECMEFDKISAKSTVMNVLKTSMVFCVCVSVYVVTQSSSQRNVSHTQTMFVPQVFKNTFYSYTLFTSHVHSVTEHKYAEGSTCMYSHFSSTHHNLRWTQKHGILHVEATEQLIIFRIFEKFHLNQSLG